MKKVFSITLLLLSIFISCYAAPIVIKDATGNVYSVTYITSYNGFNFYATQDSIDTTLYSTSFPQNGGWYLVVLLEPSEAVRQRAIKVLNTAASNGDNHYTFVRTPSGSRHLWALMEVWSYVPAKNTIFSGTEEDYYNENGEVMCLSEVKQDVFDLNDPQRDFYINVNKQIQQYLRAEYNKRSGYAN